MTSQKIFSLAIFSHSRKLFSKFPQKIVVIILHDIVGLKYMYVPFSQS